MIPYDPRLPLFSLHVAKCGGNSVAQLLKACFGEKLRLHYRGQGDEPPPRHDVGPGMCVHGHFEEGEGTGVLAYYPEAAQFVTILRDPFDLRLSWHSFARSKRRNALTRASNPWLAAVDEDLEAYLERVISLGQQGLAGRPLGDAAAPQTHIGALFEYLPFPFTLDNYAAILGERFVYVGIVEELQASANALTERLGFYPRQLGVRNQSRGEPPEAAHLRDAYRRAFPLEYAVYEYALRHHADAGSSWGKAHGWAAPRTSAQADFVHALTTAECELILPQPVGASAPELAEPRATLARAAGNGVTTVAIGREGFEPTRVEGLWDLIAEAKGLGFERVVLHTQGSALADRAVVDRLAASGVSRVVMSLTSGDAALGDWLCTLPGATAAKLRAVESCVAAGMPVHLSLLLLRPCLRGLPALARHVVGLGATRLALAGRVPDGAVLAKEGIAPEQFGWLYPAVEQVREASAALAQVVPGWFVVGRELPLCLAATLPAGTLLPLDDAPLPYPFAEVPRSCDGCVVEAHCPARRYTTRTTARLWEHFERSAPALADVGLKLLDMLLTEGRLELTVEENGQRHDLRLQRLDPAARHFVAGRRYALTYGCACAPRTAAAKTLVTLFEAFALGGGRRTG